MVAQSVKLKGYYTKYPLLVLLLPLRSITTFGYTKPLSILLQGSTMDVITAYNDIHTEKNTGEGLSLCLS